jgi:uncharacterized protein YjiS (DUF1127 family)
MFTSLILSNIRRWFRYRDTVRQLSNLTDAQLSDIGLTRNDITTIAWQVR